MDERFAQLLCSKLGWKMEKLPFPSLPVKGYDGKRGASITSFLRVHLILDGRKIYNVPFLVLPLGNHDMIIGKSFMEYFDISPSVAQKRLHWPRAHPKTTKAISQGIQIPRQILKRPRFRDHYQLDMEARDKLIEQEERRRLAGCNSIAHIYSNGSRYTSAATQTELDMPHEPPKPCGKSESQPHQEHDRTTLPSDESSQSKNPSSPQDTLDLLAKELPQKHTSVSPRFMPRPDLARHTYELDHQDRLKQMKAELQGSLGTIPSTQKARKVTVEEGSLNHSESLYLAIHEISATAFQLCTRRSNHEVFTTSLYEIDRILEDIHAQEANPDPADGHGVSEVSKVNELAGIAQDIAHSKNRTSQSSEGDEFARLPVPYQAYRDVASKAESNRLAPHRSYDHRIELEKEASTSDLKFHPLYRMSAEELETVKKYLVENLDKGFIEPSQAPFAAPASSSRSPMDPFASVSIIGS
jgi:hypothetical protein